MSQPTLTQSMNTPSRQNWSLRPGDSSWFNIVSVPFTSWVRNIITRVKAASSLSDNPSIVFDGQESVSLHLLRTRLLTFSRKVFLDLFLNFSDPSFTFVQNWRLVGGVLIIVYHIYHIWYFIIRQIYRYLLFFFFFFFSFFYRYLSKELFDYK